MDWVVNASSLWDMTELDIDEFDVVGNNQNMEVFSADSASVVSGDGIINKWSEQKQSSKKPRGHVSCLVDECKLDLSGCRDYHRRHRVCETHSKTPVVKIGGNDQRFCQQCSRFHSLGEFDDVKRSCRKRLDGHNKRRRKPKTDPMYLNYGSFLTDHQGTRLLHFGGSPAHTTTFGSWPDNEKLNQKLHVSVEQTTPSNSYARERKFPFLLDTDCNIVNQPYSEASFQQVVNTNASAVEHKSALSLLSKQTIHHHHHHHHDSESGPSPTDLVQFNGSLYQQSNPHIPLRNVAGTANNYLLGMVQFRTGGLLENGAPQVLSFSWE